MDNIVKINKIDVIMMYYHYLAIKVNKITKILVYYHDFWLFLAFFMILSPLFLLFAWIICTVFINVPNIVIIDTCFFWVLIRFSCLCLFFWKCIDFIITILIIIDYVCLWARIDGVIGYKLQNILPGNEPSDVSEKGLIRSLLSQLDHTMHDSNVYVTQSIKSAWIPTNLTFIRLAMLH